MSFWYTTQTTNTSSAYYTHAELQRAIDQQRLAQLQAQQYMLSNQQAYNNMLNRLMDSAGQQPAKPKYPSCIQVPEGL